MLAVLHRCCYAAGRLAPSTVLTKQVPGDSPFTCREPNQATDTAVLEAKEDAERQEGSHKLVMDNREYKPIRIKQAWS
jgi:hypothetical protein